MMRRFFSPAGAGHAAAPCPTVIFAATLATSFPS